jgi:hypothetical protein
VIADRRVCVCVCVYVSWLFVCACATVMSEIVTPERHQREANTQAHAHHRNVATATPLWLCAPLSISRCEDAQDTMGNEM